MAVPESEAGIRSALQLDEHASQYPAPPSGSKREYVVVIDGITCTKAAIDAALKASDDKTLRELLQYPGLILAHDNVHGHGGGGSKMEISRIVARHASKETNERIQSLLGI